MKNNIIRLITLACLFLTCWNSLLAQSSGASLSGFIYDESGKTFDGATIALNNTATGFSTTTITDTMLVAAARALADVVPVEELGPDYIIPSVFHPDVASGVAAAVREAAVRDGVTAEEDD